MEEDAILCARSSSNASSDSHSDSDSANHSEQAAMIKSPRADEEEN